SASKKDEALGLKRFLALTSATTLRRFLRKVQEKGEFDLIGGVRTWTIALQVQTTSKTEQFKDPIALDQTSSEVGLTFAKWLALAEAGRSAQIKVYGTARPKGAQAVASDTRAAPMPHIDPKIAAAAERIRDANLCGRDNCSSRSIPHPACWLVPGTTRHLNLDDEGVTIWATALAAEEDNVGERNPPQIPPYVLAKPKNAALKTKKKNGKKNGNKKEKDVHGKQVSSSDGKKRKRTSSLDESSDGIEFVGSSKAKPSEPNEPIVVSDNESSQPVPPPSKRLARRGEYMRLDEWAAAYGLPESIRKKLEAYNVPDAWVVARMDPERDYDNAKLEGGEKLTLEDVLDRWRTGQRVDGPRSSGAVTTAQSSSMEAGPSTMAAPRKPEPRASTPLHVSTSTTTCPHLSPEPAVDYLRNMRIHSGVRFSQYFATIPYRV
ncbi:hypothetical protein OC834_001952, partial [Tilletia horrida]